VIVGGHHSRGAAVRSWGDWPTFSRSTSPRGIKQSNLSHSIPTAKLRLAAIRHLFDWLVTGHVDGTGIAADAKGPLFRTVGRDGN
jgi:hypothetical protein